MQPIVHSCHHVWLARHLVDVGARRERLVHAGEAEARLESAHLREAHCLTVKAMRGTRERLGSYQLRGGDGLVHKWLSGTHSSQRRLSSSPGGGGGGGGSQRRRAADEGHVRGYWTGPAEAVASNFDALEASW